MKFFIAYASVEGQSRKIAETLASTIETRGHQAVIASAADRSEYTLERPDGVILCAPIHVGRYPSYFTDFVHREVDWLNTIPSAFVSVTLSIVSDDPAEREEAEGFAQTLMSETGWEPKVVHHAAGALRYTEYDFFKRWMLKRIADRHKAPTDTRNDYELTDWSALEAFAVNFIELCASESRSESLSQP
ncbi:MAG: protoporphyrinogen oxidase [Rhizobiaceae bacterium]|nr:protoporphyrinogen oxidase [Rhizobiaceae bacterium]